MSSSGMLFLASSAADTFSPGTRMQALVALAPKEGKPGCQVLFAGPVVRKEVLGEEMIAVAMRIASYQMGSAEQPRH